MIIAFTSLHTGGATFLDWSFHYLKGNDHFWNHEKGLMPLTSDPLQDINAHNHFKNHPGQFKGWHKFIEMAEKRSANSPDDITFYTWDQPSGWITSINWSAKASEL